MFNFQYLGPTTSDMAASVFYKTYTSSQPQARQFISKLPAGFYKDLKSLL